MKGIVTARGTGSFRRKASGWLALLCLMAMLIPAAQASGMPSIFDVMQQQPDGTMAVVLPPSEEPPQQEQPEASEPVVKRKYETGTIFAEPDTSFIGKFRSYLLSKTAFFGYEIPNLLWLGAAYVAAYLLCIGLVLLISSLTGKGKSGDARGSERVSYVDFQIVYRGKAKQTRCNVRGVFTIGSAGCALNLDKGDALVEKKHCQLAFEGGTLVLTDTSQSGTLVNSRLVLNSGIELRSGDQIQIGNHQLIVRY